MSWSPTFKLYSSDGVTLQYTFPIVQDTNEPSDPYDYVKVDGLRGIGSLIIPGSAQSWTLNLTFVIQGEDYEDLMQKVDDLNTTVEMFTPYILKIDRSQSSTKDYRVKRIVPFAITNTAENYRIDTAIISASFLVNSW